MTEEYDMTATTDDRGTGGEERLTTTQREIRDRNAQLPAHVKRSIDRYRRSLGMVPLWGSSVERHRRA
jgi:hypothetical protein